MFLCSLNNIILQHPVALCILISCSHPSPSLCIFVDILIFTLQRPRLFWLYNNTCFDLTCCSVFKLFSFCKGKHYAMKAYGGVDVYLHIFLTSALAGGEWSASRSIRFTPEERAPGGTHWIEGWVDSRACLGDVEKRKFLDLTGTRTPTPLLFSP
jgi:hypothetical protein